MVSAAVFSFCSRAIFREHHCAEYHVFLVQLCCVSIRIDAGLENKRKKEKVEKKGDCRESCSIQWSPCVETQEPPVTFPTRPSDCWPSS
jgi:hypothetical protein